MAKKQRKNHNSCLLDGCIYADFTGCTDVDFDGGCLDFGGDGCVDLDIGGCFDFGGGCSMLFLFPLRWIVILGLMLYGDWDYQHHRAKIQ